VAHTCILATQEAEIRRITVQSQPRQIVLKTLSRKYPTQKRAGRVAQDEGPEFKTQYHKKSPYPNHDSDLKNTHLEDKQQSFQERI
jgi:predicted P-loop ATPase